jgi:alkylated DNA nucleotide flippase Atl1
MDAKEKRQRRVMKNLIKRHGLQKAQAVVKRLEQAPFKGGTYTDVAAILGLSRERARQIADAMGMASWELGSASRAVLDAATRIEPQPPTEFCLNSPASFVLQSKTVKGVYAFAIDGHPARVWPPGDEPGIIAPEGLHPELEDGIWYWREL